MADGTDNSTALQIRIDELQAENELLKKLLDRAGIPYEPDLKKLKLPQGVEPYDKNQGGRISRPTEITDDMVKSFLSFFHGRADVFARRSVKKNTGEVGYYPQCVNFWTDGCARKKQSPLPCRECTFRKPAPLQIRDIRNHLLGHSENGTDVIGIYPLMRDNTSQLLVFDFDHHGQDAQKDDYANKNDDWREEVEAMRTICKLNGIDALVERSRSGRGAHIWIFFEKPIKASLIRSFGVALLEKGAQQVNLTSFSYYDRMLPAQDCLANMEYGNLIALPLQGRALNDGNSAFIDENWNAYQYQWRTLLGKKKLSEEFIQQKMKEWADESQSSGGMVRSDDHPWDNRDFVSSDVSGKMEITLADGIYINKKNLCPAILNNIRHLAAFHNPVYFKNIGLGKSNFDTPSWIYLGEDHSEGYLEIPRGCYSELIRKNEKAGIEYTVHDERQYGRPIRVSFNGSLYDYQKDGLQEMMKYENGIMQATTAYGKTVVCNAMIAERKVNTLIILEKKDLIPQWKESFEKFLTIDEELPFYETKTKKKRRRKSVIGILHGSTDTTTGIIDIAMVGSICRKDVFHERLNQYGMVIVDECHHVASSTMQNVLKEVKARYVYGVTATPNRADHMQKINYMLLGPLRYRYTAKQRAKARGIGHYVYPRFTRTVSPRGVFKDRKNANEGYAILRNNPIRDQQILSDIRECVTKGRTSVVLSRYTNHITRLYKAAKDYADHVYLLVGKNSAKDNEAMIREMKGLPSDESVILFATGSLIGEGFDFPRLDTLFMATPVSAENIVEQYAGRLHRDYEGKEDVIIYDYVDTYIPMFDRMYAKRLKTYKKIGYEIYSEMVEEPTEKNAIFDADTYSSAFKDDLVHAQSTIVISSTEITNEKIIHLMNTVEQLQHKGVTVTVVTWDPDHESFGDSTGRMAILEEIRQSAILLKTMEEHCANFAIIDQTTVWYGNIMLLGRDLVDTTMMRVESREIAAELMEVTFGEKQK